MKDHNKTKKIHKKAPKGHQIEKLEPLRENPQQQGDPSIKNLSDFVVAIAPTYVSKPLYTGGRITTGNGNKLYSACNHNVVSYCLKERKVLQTIRHKNEQISNFAVDPSQKHILTYTNNNLLRIIHLQTQKVLNMVKLGPKFFANDITFSPDGRFIAVGFANSMIKIYLAQTMKETHSYRNHTLPVRKVEWHPNPDSLQVVSIDQNKNLVVFDFILNKVIGQVKNAGKCFAITSKGTSIVAACDKIISVYDFKTLTVQFSIDTPEYIDSILCLQNGTIVFGGEQTVAFNIDLNDTRHEIRNSISCVDTGVLKILPFFQNKEFMVVSAQQNLTLVDSRTLQAYDTIIGFNDEIIDLKYSKHGNKETHSSQFIVMITNSSNAKILDRKTLKLISFVTGHQDTILCCEYFHPFLVTAGKDKVIKLHEIDPLGRAKLIANYHGHSEYICGLSVMIDRKLIVSASEDKTLKLWPLIPQKQNKIEIKNALSTISAHTKSINAVRTSPSEQFIATCSHDRSVKIWGPDLKPYFTLTGHKRGVWDAAFHSIEKLIVTVGGDGALKGWSLFNGECQWSLGQGFALMRCQWLYHHQVITASLDGIVKIWDIRKQTSLSYDKHQGKIWALEVCKDSNSSEGQGQQEKVQILSGGNDSIFYVWRDTTDATRDHILKDKELKVKQRILFDQLLHDQNYLEAAKLAFQTDYPQLFINTVNQMLTKMSSAETDISFQDDRLIIDEKDEPQNKINKVQLQEFMRSLFEYDGNRLLNLLYTMTSTVKSYMSAQTLFLALLKSIPLQRLVELDRQFSLSSRKRVGLDALESKQSEFQQFLEKMLMYTDRHLNRIEKYIRGTYHMDHGNRKERII